MISTGLFVTTFLAAAALGAGLYICHRRWNQQRRRLEAENRDLQRQCRHVRRRFRDFCQLLPEIVLETDTDGIITFFSDATCSLTGYSAEFLGQQLPVSKILQPDNQAAFGQALAVVLSGGVEILEDLRLRCADGTTIPVRFRAAPLQLTAGDDITGTRMVFYDIRGELDSRQALNHSQAVEAAIITILNSLSKVTEGEMDTAVAEALVSIGGLTTIDRFFMVNLLEDGDALNWEYEWYADGVAVLSEEGKLSRLSDSPWLQEQINLGRIIHVEDVAALPEAMGVEKKRWLERGTRSCLVIPMFQSGEVVGLLGFDAVRSTGNWCTEDIRLLETIAGILVGALQRRLASRAMREANDRLMDIIEFLPDATFVIDGSQKVVAWNRAMEEMTGVPKEEMIGKGDYAYAVPFYGEPLPILVDHFGDADLGHWRKLYKFVEINRDTLYAESFTPFLNNGKGAYLWLTASPLFDSEGRVVGAIESIRDISYRKRSEKALRESQRTLSTLMSNLPGMVYRCAADDHWNLEFVSEGCQKLTGQSVADLLSSGGADFLETVHRDDQQAVKLGMEAAQDRQEDFSLEHRIVRADGTSRWVLNQGQGTISETDQTAHFEGVLTDITEGKTAEFALREGEQKYRRLIETMNDGMGVVDQDGRMAFVNDRLCDMLGYTRGDLLGTAVIPLLTELKVDQGLLTTIAKAPGQLDVQEVDIVNRDNTRLTLRVSPVAITAEDGSPLGGFALCSDMTSMREAEAAIHQLNEELEQRVLDGTRELLATNQALRLSEARYRRIIENLQEGYIFYSHGGGTRFSYVSPSFRLVLGYRTIKEFSQAVEDSLKKTTNKQARICSQKSELGFRQPSYDLHVQHHDGSDRILEILEVPVFDDNGQVISVEGIAHDVTEQRRNLDLVKSAQEQLVEAEKMAALGSLVAGLSHEINTPIGIGVTASSHLEQMSTECLRAFNAGQLTKSGFEDFMQSSKETATLIQNNLNRSADLLQNFKQVAVDQSAGQERLFEMKEYLDDVVRSLSPNFRNTGFGIAFTCPDDLKLQCDPGALYQILTNLVMNSLTHGFDGMLVGQINIAVRREDGQIIIEYADNGNGMSRQQVARIYEPFFTTKRGRGGTGLGMHIVYNNVTQTLGGSITCASKPGRGTRFIISVPLMAEVEHG